MITVSTITPVYNGEKFLLQLVSRIEEERVKWENEYTDLKLVESIFVIDGAKDNSLAILRDVAKQKEWVRVIELSRNFGQHPATIAGILHSSGEWVVTLDEDLQHDPKNILALLKQTALNGDDICYGLASSSTHDSFIRDKFSRFFKRLVANLSGEKNITKFNSFRLIRGSIARASASIASYDSYYDIVMCWFTSRISTCSFEMEDIRNKTGEGKSGYSFMQLVKHGKRMIMTSKVKFLRIGIFIGILAFSFSVMLSFYALYAKFWGGLSVANQGWASIILAVIFFGGLSLLLAGFILESVSDILLNAKGKPTFFVVDRSLDEDLKNSLNKE